MAELFPGQENDEQIYLIIREHWFYLLAKMSIWILFILVLLAFEYFVPLYVPATYITPFAAYITLVRDLYLIFLVLGIFMTWAKYYLNIKIVTNERVVDITHETMFSHTISELGLEKIEDVTSETTGIFGSLFSFGNVYIQTAGKEERFTFDSVPQPDKLERLILNLYSKRMADIKAGASPIE